jgi:DNA-binding NtrC family response regulator
MLDGDWSSDVCSSDLIDDMTQRMQQSLAQVMAQKTISRNPGEVTALDIRIMAAVSDDITDLIVRETFSKDLYDLLSAFIIRIPPLRERKDDIAPLCSYFMDKFGKEYDKSVKTVSDEVLTVFNEYGFPGNVQELANLIERAVLLIDGSVIELRHLPEKFRNPGHRQAMKDDRTFLSLADIEKNHILKVTSALGQNRTKAAEVLGISRGALWRKLKQYGEE